MLGFLLVSREEIASSSNPPFLLIGSLMPAWFLAVYYVLGGFGMNTSTNIMNAYSSGLNLLLLGLRMRGTGASGSTPLCPGAGAASYSSP